MIWGRDQKGLRVKMEVGWSLDSESYVELGGEGGQGKGRGWKGVFLYWGHQVWEQPGRQGVRE